MTRVTGCGKPYHFYAITAESGVSVDCDAHTLLGAKREASAWMSFGGGSVTLIDKATKETWTREFWQSGRSFGWNAWKKIA
jgi:hypothetical protein